MTEESSVNSFLDVAKQTITAAGCASPITVDESGYPASPAVAAFPPNVKFSRIVIGTHLDSRQNAHVMCDPRIVLSDVDNTNRSYLTVIGKAHIEAESDERAVYWVDRFSTFFPNGPES